MARPVYPHDISDPDFQWLLSTFRENNPDCVSVETSCLPIVLIRGVLAVESAKPYVPAEVLPGSLGDDPDFDEDTSEIT